MRWILAVSLVLAACSSKRTERESPYAAEAKRCGKRGVEVECARPIIRVESLKAAPAYYRDKMGFKVDWDHGDPPNFGSVSRGEFVLFMCEQCQSSAGAWSMTFVHDVDKLYADLQKRGAIIKMPPTDMPWELREMHVADPDGNVIRFGSSIEHE